MRLHRNVAEAIVKGLSDIHIEENLAGYVVPSLLKSNKKWGSRDRKLIAESIYDITRYWRFFQCKAGTDELTKQAIWHIVAAYLQQKEIDLPEWDEFKDLNTPDTDCTSQFVVRESIPDWLNELGRAQLGDQTWEAEIEALNKPAEVVLRINNLALPNEAKQKPIEFIQQQLAKENVQSEVVEHHRLALQLQKRSSIQHTKVFRNGWVEIQDANSQAVAPFCMPKKDDVIIDCCAGAGGKSLHLAALLNCDADIFALDVAPHKIKELEKRALRANAMCIEAGLVIEFPFDEFKDSADIVLIDAPCTGLGTLKRDPDKKWKLTPEFLAEIKLVQQQILQSYASLTKVGGKLIYATCSILPMENEAQVKQFLESEVGEAFVLEEEQTLFAHQTGYDGFYMARLVRKK